MTFIELRKRSGQTVEETCHKLGVKSGTLRKYESGERTPSTVIILKMRQVYNATEEEIFNALVTNGKKGEEQYGRAVNGSIGECQ